MEAAVGSEVWVRGAGLNAEGAENRARDILGPGWRSAVATGKILRKNRKGQVQVKLDGGPTVWVAAEFVSTEALAPGDEPEPDPEEYFADQELGSEIEAGDIAQEKEGEPDGSESRQHVRAERNCSTAWSV